MLALAQERLRPEDGRRKDCVRKTAADASAPWGSGYAATPFLYAASDIFAAMAAVADFQWDIDAFCAGWLSAHASHWLSAVSPRILTAATVSPVDMLYPNLAPHPWRPEGIVGAVLWGAILLWMLPAYPNNAMGALTLSLAYRIAYTLRSLVLDARHRRRSRLGEKPRWGRTGAPSRWMLG